MLSVLRPKDHGRSNWLEARISQAKKSGGFKFWRGLKETLRVQAVVKERFVKAAQDLNPTWAKAAEKVEIENAEKSHVVGNKVSEKASIGKIVPDAIENKTGPRKKLFYSSNYKVRAGAKNLLAPRIETPGRFFALPSFAKQSKIRLQTRPIECQKDTQFFYAKKIFLNNVSMKTMQPIDAFFA